MIKATIRFDSDFHIGSGVGKAGYIDSLFIKDTQDNPIITGQTLKGIIRDSCKRIANSFNIPCKENRKCTCLICEIFGRASRPGKYLFTPATQKPSSKNKKEYPVRRRTSIDIHTGTAKREALFSTEVARKGVEFGFTIRPKPSKKPEELEEALLIAGILWTREIGGNRRRGLGHCKIEIKEPVIDRESLKKQLLKLQELDRKQRG
jgi:CRISPR/Cas system CSM-associated protein Csm3 (group 7 of RAMP superfamily)